MKVLVKTLKGSKFAIEADESSTVAAVKGIIVSSSTIRPEINANEKTFMSCYHPLHYNTPISNGYCCVDSISEEQSKANGGPFVDDILRNKVSASGGSFPSH